VALNDAPISAEIHGDVTSFNSLIGVDPRFVDAANGDYRLLVTSIAINIGDDALAVDDSGVPLSTDLDGNARIVHGQVDIGAYEYQGPVATTWEVPSSVVTTLLDVADKADGEISLREAFVYGCMLAQDVTFAAGLTGGTVTLTEGELGAYRSLTVDATSIGALTVDAAGNSRVMFIANGAEVSLIGLTLTGGSTTSDGGGICNGGLLTLTNSTVSGNSATDDGGGIYNTGDLTVLDSVLSNNSTGGVEYCSGGGGIYNTGDLTVLDSVLSDNSASGVGNYSGGGGIYNYYGTLTLTNTTVSGNSASGVEYLNGGGGIYSFYGALTLTNTTVSGNSAAIDGGGIHNFYGALTVTNSAVLSNLATVDGAGIYNGWEGVLTLTYVTVDGNEADRRGGGIYNRGVTTLTDVTVSGNSAGDWGGGIYSNGELSMTNVLITANHAGYDGGGISSGGALTLTDSTVSGNSADRYGGAIYGYGTLVITDVVISDNIAEDEGGGIYNEGGTMVLTSVTISDNVATVGENHSGGGAIRHRNGTLAMSNCLVIGNELTWDDSEVLYPYGVGGGGIYNSGGMVTLANCTVSENMVTELPVSSGTYENGGGGIYTTSPATLTLNNSIVALNTSSADHPELYGAFGGSRNVIGVDPGFMDPDDGNYRLSGTSLAINRGDNALAVDADGQPLPTDLDGAPRISDGVVDLGAYEYQGSPDAGRESPSTTATILGDTTDSTDGQTSLREALVHAMVGDMATAVQFGPVLAGGRFVLTSGELLLHGGVSVDGQSIGSVTIDAAGADRVLYVVGNDEVVLSGLTITGGDAFRGGGIYNLVGPVTLMNSTVSGNSANNNGGGIYNDDGTVTLMNSTMSGNSSTGTYTRGGGIYNGNGALTLTNSTISGNSASGNGGGIYDNGNLTLNNTIVALNEAPTNPDIRGSFTNNSSLVGADPGFVRNPSPGADGVWGTEDDDYGDLLLLPTSPAVDAGDKDLLPPDEFDLDNDGNTAERLPIDLAGNPRIMLLGSTVDIGAYEFVLPQTVFAHHVFYNNSYFDGNDISGNFRQLHQLQSRHQRGHGGHQGPSRHAGIRRFWFQDQRSRGAGRVVGRSGSNRHRPPGRWCWRL